MKSGIPKCRGLTIDTKEEVKGYACEVGGKYYIILGDAELISPYGPIKGLVEVDPASVGMFTGIRDRKRTKEFPEGQEIYGGFDNKGGDIVRDDKGNVGYIRYRADSCSMEFEIKAALGDAFYDYMGPKWSIDELEVIGSVALTPELLKEQNNGH